MFKLNSLDGPADFPLDQQQAAKQRKVSDLLYPDNPNLFPIGEGFGFVLKLKGI
jgi:hypothetical protein